jgi:hypothetical protein
LETRLLCHKGPQTYLRYDVIIGNDGSNDNRAAVLAPFLHRRALKRQSFPVSGSAQVDDPIFR